MKLFNKKIFNKIKTNATYRLSKINSESAKIILLKSKISQYGSEIERLQPIYLDNYVKIATYLHDDFSLKKFSFKAEGETVKVVLKDEMNLEKETKKILKDIKGFKAFDKLNFNKKIRRWWILSTILQPYPYFVNKLMEVCGQNMYKDLDLDYELKTYELNKYLIEKDLAKED